MSIGIYRLVFSGTTKCYIGQSVNIEKRYLQHIQSFKNRTATKKLIDAHTLYGLPTLEILVECEIIELNDNEELAISIFDAVNNGFNTYSSATETPYGKGLDAGNSKYTENELRQAYLLLDTQYSLTYQEISDKVGIPSYIVANLARGDSHEWLKLEYPEIAAYLASDTAKAVRRDISSTAIMTKNSASARGIQYPSLKHKDGRIASNIENMRQFARDNDLRANHLNEVVHRKRKSCGGWSLNE